MCRNWRISTFNFYKLYQEAEPKLSIFSLTASIQTMFSTGKLTSYSKHAESKGRCKVFVGVNGIYTKCCDTSWNFVTTHDSDCHGKPLEWRSLQVLTKQWEADGMEMGNLACQESHARTAAGDSSYLQNSFDWFGVEVLVRLLIVGSR